VAKTLRSEDIKMIAVDKLEPNDWNPQTMTDAKFNELVEEIREDGFDDSIHVVPHPDPTKVGIYRIINGEHRWQAARVLGISEIPCVVKDKWVDEKTQQIKTVRRNLLRGDLDRARFSKLVRQLNDVGIALKDLPAKLGFENDAEFRDKFIAQERDKEEQKVQAATRTAKDDEKRESAVVGNLSFILNEIFSQYGDTVQQGFIFFCHRNKFHLLVQMDDKIQKLIEAAVKYLRESGKNINPFLRKALDLEFDEIEKTDGADPRKIRQIKNSPGSDEAEDELDADDVDENTDDADDEDGSEEVEAVASDDKDTL
jgi:ParB-like chromosome segregation protein Spo0J